jgi:large subunit ribosomal protein L31
MKKEIQPEYFADAVITCACGVKHKIGSTKKEIHVEICSACHPFYTGESKTIDAAGRVERFRARKAAAQPLVPKKAKKVRKEETEEEK